MSGAFARWSHRSIFISDVHLGSRLCTAGALLDFLAANSSATLFIVGDAVDFWSMRGRSAWDGAHGEVLLRICRMMQAGMRVVLIPGNHDAHLGGFLDLPLERLEIRREYLHTTADGQRFLVVHGDRHDVVMRRVGHLAHLGSALKERAACLSRPLARTMRRLDRRDGSISATWTLMRRRLGGVARLEAALVGEARSRRAHGVVCGHTHLAADEDMGGIRYLNCGDWVGSSTAIVENWSGRLELIRWDGRPTPVTTRQAVAEPACEPQLGGLVSARTAGEAP